MMFTALLSGKKYKFYIILFKLYTFIKFLIGQASIIMEGLIAFFE